MIYRGEGGPKLDVFICLLCNWVGTSYTILRRFYLQIVILIGGGIRHQTLAQVRCKTSKVFKVKLLRRGDSIINDLTRIKSKISRTRHAKVHFVT